MIRDRIKELRRVPARELVANPRNWRTHPRQQQDALRGILAEVGYADALLARELPDGRLMLIDGHLRAETTPDQEVPVLVLDIDDVDADKILATLNPLSGMAEADFQKLDELLGTIEIESASVMAMLENVWRDAQRALQVDNDDFIRSIPKMELMPYEHYDYVLVLARTTHQWEQLCELLGVDKVDASIVPAKSMKKIGLGRCISAERLIRLLCGVANPNRDTEPAEGRASLATCAQPPNGDSVRG